ncbi:hypothetical protein Tco_1183341 [Tanacetum coccineum]
MECLYKEDVDRIFTLDEPFEEMGSKAIEVPALKEDVGSHSFFIISVLLGVNTYLPMSSTGLHEMVMADSESQYNVQSCFLDIQLTSLSSRNCIPPEVLLRYRDQPTMVSVENSS